MFDVTSIQSILSDYTFQIVALGTVALGVISGVVGSFVTLRKESLLGDTLSHAALPGIVLMFMVIGEKVTPLLLTGAVITGLLAVFLLQTFTEKLPLKLDGVMALILSSFFGLGLVLLTHIQGQANANQAGLTNFIFGQASAMLQSDVQLILTVSAINLLVISLLWHPFKLITFDLSYAKTVYPGIRWLNVLLSLIIVVTIMIGLESVGVILISSLLIGPSITARQWTDRLLPLVVIAGFIGGISSFTGTFLSSTTGQLPTGPAIVVVLSIILFVSLFIAPKNGLISQMRSQRKHQKTLQMKEVDR